MHASNRPGLITAATSAAALFLASAEPARAWQAPTKNVSIAQTPSVIGTIDSGLSGLGGGGGPGQVLGPAAPCSTPGFNRNQCGALLLFPEFDNTRGTRTFFTISNSCPPAAGGNLRVEVVVISKLSCNETQGGGNFPINLTPYDQYSWFSSNSLFVGVEGFFYAFVRKATPPIDNDPLPLNQLTGIETIIDGTQAFSYSLNAVAFRGIDDGNPLTDNDYNTNDLLDLNGLEYEPAPDQIVIPRFLGQDPAAPPPVFDSEMILFSLTGGSGFATTAKVEVYSEQGVLLSAPEVAFNCWTKLPLRTISSFTENASLDVLPLSGDADSDPGENLNPGGRQAGWMRITGVNAIQGETSIPDPVVYAVLVERSGGTRAATLPFELCSQTGGVLR